MQQFFAMKFFTIDIFLFFHKMDNKDLTQRSIGGQKNRIPCIPFCCDEKHCFTRRVVKNYFAHLSILKRYFSNLSHFYSGRSPSVMHDSNRLNCTLFYSHPQNAFIYVTCLSESRFSGVIESCGWQSNLLSSLALQRSPLPLTKRALQAGVKVKLYS